MITVVGSANVDLVSRVPRLPERGETVLATDYFQTPGGKGANQAVAAARAECRVAFVGRLGADEHGEGLLANLQAQGVITDYLTVDRASPTGRAMIAIDDQGENTIVVIPGANGNLAPEDIQRATVIGESSVVVLQLEIPIVTVACAVEAASAARATVLLNSAPASLLKPSVLRKIDILVANADEIGIMSGLGSPTDPAESAHMLLQTGPRAVIVTLGEQGVVIVTREQELNLPAFTTQAVDSTGAGDTFVGNLAAALDAGRDLETSARFATAAAALSIRLPGAQSSMPTRRETETLLKEAAG